MIEPMNRDWKSYDAYLFDIDGTLLNCRDAVHYFAFCDALSSVAGRPVNLDGVQTHGNVDVGILRDAFAAAAIPEAVWRPKLPLIRRQMEQFVSEHAAGFDITVLPGVRAVLGLLRGKGAVLGVATGNLEEIGRCKLGHCGLLESFDFGGYSDAFEYRRDVFGEAVARARALAGERAHVCVVGDTPEDIRAARANGLDVVAVATGTHAFAVLEAEAPNWCLHSLEELDGI